MLTSKYGTDSCIFTDPLGAPHEKRWIVGPADAGPGVKVAAYDDGGMKFDEITLRRFGAFIVLEPFADGAPKDLPECLEFLRASINARARLRTIGILQEPLPVCVHSYNLQRIVDSGVFPLLKGYPPKGKAEFFGITVVWNQDLDYMLLV